MRLSNNSNTQAPQLAKPAYLALLVVVVLLSSTRPYAQPPATPTETQVEAAFLFKFGSFVSWPNPAPDNAFSICILGRDPFGIVLDSLVQGESLNAVPFAVRRITEASAALPCRIVFISASEEGRLHPLLNELEKFHVLTVADMPHFVDRGGMIQFVLDNGRVRFQANVNSAEKSGLTLSSQLLKVASAIKRDGARD